MRTATRRSYDSLKSDRPWRSPRVDQRRSNLGRTRSRRGGADELSLGGWALFEQIRGGTRCEGHGVLRWRMDLVAPKDVGGFDVSTREDHVDAWWDIPPLFASSVIHVTATSPSSTTKSARDVPRCVAWNGSGCDAQRCTRQRSGSAANCTMITIAPRGPSARREPSHRKRSRESNAESAPLRQSRQLVEGIGGPVELVLLEVKRTEHRGSATRTREQR